MKRLSKLLIILSIVAFIFCVIPQNVSFAGKISNMVKATQTTGKGMIKIGDEVAAKVVKKILSLLQIASALITIVVISFTGFNYIVAADAEMKSEMKKKMLPIVIGLILVFSATSISKFLLSAVTK